MAAAEAHEIGLALGNKKRGSILRGRGWQLMAKGARTCKGVQVEDNWESGLARNAVVPVGGAHVCQAKGKVVAHARSRFFVEDMVLSKIWYDIICRRYLLSKIWYVEDIFCRRYGMSKIIFVEDMICRRYFLSKICMVCRRYFLSKIWYVEDIFVEDMVCRRY